MSQVISDEAQMAKAPQKTKIAIMVIDDPNFGMQALEAQKPPDRDGPTRFSDTTMTPDYPAMKRWFEARHPGLKTEFVVFTNIKKGKEHNGKRSWVKYLRSTGVEVHVNEQRIRLKVDTDEISKTDVDRAMRKRIRRYVVGKNHHNYEVVEVIAVSHDGRCFGGVGRRNEPGASELFDQLADLDIPVAYMGFGGLPNRPQTLVEGVSYIDIQEVTGAIPFDFPRYDLEVRFAPLPPPPWEIEAPSEVSQPQEGWLRRTWKRIWNISDQS